MGNFSHIRSPSNTDMPVGDNGGVSATMRDNNTGELFSVDESKMPNIIVSDRQGIPDVMPGSNRMGKEVNAFAAKYPHG
jgi:hypothetical protein